MNKIRSCIDACGVIEDALDDVLEKHVEAKLVEVEVIYDNIEVSERSEERLEAMKNLIDKLTLRS